MAEDQCLCSGWSVIWQRISVSVVGGQAYGRGSVFV